MHNKHKYAKARYYVRSLDDLYVCTIVEFHCKIYEIGKRSRIRLDDAIT